MNAEMLSGYQRARDVLAGEDAVKARGEAYLPRLECQSDEEYGVYKTRASFFPAARRSLQEHVDLIFRRKPVVAMGAGEALKTFARDCDLWGLGFERYAREIATEVLSVGRAGSLVLWDPTGRPYVTLHRTETILEWGVSTHADRVSLTHVLLGAGDLRRAFRMIDGRCVEEELRFEDGAWVSVRSAPVERSGVGLSFIPFVFHGAAHSRPEPGPLPLGDLIALNLDHYRLDADLKKGLHCAALPTAWVSGFESSLSLKVGSSTAWVAEAPGAQAGFLEFTGAGLVHLEKAIEKVERRMALLGARLLEAAAPSEAGVGTPRTQLSGLGSIAASLNQSLTRVLQVARWWCVGGQLEAAGAGVGMELNTDYSAAPMTSSDLDAVVNAWRSGAISRDTMLELLRRGEMLPDGRTVAEEKAMIHRGKT